MFPLNLKQYYKNLYVIRVNTTTDCKEEICILHWPCFWKSHCIRRYTLASKFKFRGQLYHEANHVENTTRKIKLAFLHFVQSHQLKII